MVHRQVIEVPNSEYIGFDTKKEHRLFEQRLRARLVLCTACCIAVLRSHLMLL